MTDENHIEPIKYDGGIIISKDDIIPDTLSELCSLSEQEDAHEKLVADAKKIPEEFNFFVTGSRAYGRPRKNSDIDVVMLVNKETYRMFYKLNDNYNNLPTIRFGNINAIMVTTVEQYDAWKKVTKDLIKQKPVTRNFAIKYIEDYFKSIELDTEYIPIDENIVVSIYKNTIKKCTDILDGVTATLLGTSNNKEETQDAN